jgi:4-amino-4-deoxy-L-arabinose transferase-like glycosyltransferase
VKRSFFSASMNDATSNSGMGPTRGRSIQYTLLLIVLVALGLRVWGITFGLPYDFTPDEVHEIYRALKLGAGEYSMDRGKGGLYLILFVEYGFLFIFWWLTGQVQGATDFAIRYLQDPTAFYLLGRLTVAVMGALTCLVIYAVGRRIYGARAGLIAAFIGATTYYHAMWSHYINVDTGMTLALWMSVLAYLSFEDTQRWRSLVAAGALAGVAVAFKLPGGIVLPILLLAIATSTSGGPGANKFKQMGVVLVAMTATTAVIAPGVFLQIPKLASNFSNLIFAEARAAVSQEYEWADIYEITVLHGGSYISILLRDYNVALTLAALVGMAVGLWHRHRWCIIWAVSVLSFVLLMTLADRGAVERYLMPLIPAFWLLAARAVEFVGRGRPALMGILVVVIVLPSLYALIEQNYTWTRPDTRVLAKSWIEENVAPDARILMDGMQFRFIQSPPLTPNTAAVARRVDGVMDKEGRVSRGVSEETLRFYARAMEGMEGPKYDLHSTVWGLGVEELDYYVDACFDYVVTSSGIAKRFERDRLGGRFPVSQRFYRGIDADPRFEHVYSAEPVRWKVQGPTINIYRVEPCG